MLLLKAVQSYKKYQYVVLRTYLFNFFLFFPLSFSIALSVTLSAILSVTLSTAFPATPTS